MNWTKETDILTANAKLYIVGDWNTKNGSVFERELLLEGSVTECLEKAVEDEKELRGMSIKDFLLKYPQFSIRIQHLDMCGGCFNVTVYNTTLSFSDPIFTHIILDQEVESFCGDFDALITDPIESWIDWRNRTDD